MTTPNSENRERAMLLYGEVMRSSLPETTLFDALTEAERRGYNKAIEDAAKVAESVGYDFGCGIMIGSKVRNLSRQEAVWP